MVKWVNAQNFGSDIGAAIREAGAMLYGDTLTPALKQEQLTAAQNQNDGLANFQNAVRTMGRIPGTPNSGPATGVRSPQVPNVITGPRVDAMAIGETPTPAWVRYNNTGATRNQPLNPELYTALSFLPELGVEMEVFSGGQPEPGGGPRVGSTRHDHGNAADVFFYKDGRRLDWNNPADVPIFQEIVARGRQSGLTGFGAGDGYMQPGSMHVGFGDPAVWGAGGKSENAPEWLQQAYNGTAAFTGTPVMAPPTASPFTGAPSMDPGTYNPESPQMFAELLANGVAAGMTPQQAAEAALFMTSNTFGAESQATVNAAVGAGGRYGDTYSGFAQDQNRQMWETGFNDANELVDVIRNGAPLRITKSQMQPGDAPIMSETETKGMFGQQVFPTATPEQQSAYLGMEPKNVQQPDMYVDPNSGESYLSVDGLTDIHGRAVPMGSRKTSLVSPDAASAGLTTANRTQLNQQAQNLETFRGDLTAARDLAMKDPTMFGLAGQLRRFGQNVMQQIDQLKATGMTAEAAALESTLNTFTEKNDAMLAEIDEAIVGGRDPEGLFAQFFAEEYDPTLSAVDLYATILPYAAGAALANQTGVGFSNVDKATFQNAIGNPNSFLSTQRGFINGLNNLDAMAARRYEAIMARLGGQPGAGPAQPPDVDRIGNVSDGAPRQLSDTDVQTMPINDLLKMEVPLTEQQKEILDRRLKEAESLLGVP